MERKPLLLIFLAVERITIGNSLNLAVNAVSKENDNGVSESTVSQQSLPINVLVSLDPNKTATGPLSTLHHVVIQTSVPPLHDQ